MADRHSSRSQIEDLISEVQAAPDLVKFELFTVLRQELAGSLDPEHSEARLIRERREALDYLGKAIELLGLGPREVPTEAQFDALAKEQEWPWHGQKVRRAWERWRNATQAYLGTRKIETPATRKRRRYRRGPEGPATERHIEALKSWLATDPEVLTPSAYNEFAEEHNKHLPKGAAAFGTANTIRRNLSITWASGLRVARGELTIKEAFESDLADRLPKVIDADTLVGSPAIALVLKTTLQGVADLSSKTADFPTPVAHISGNPAWLYEDIKLFRRGLEFPERKVDERQYSILGAPELAARLERKERRLRGDIREKRWDRVPEPEGALGVGTFYWRREKIEAWEAARTQDEQAQAERQAGEQAEQAAATGRRNQARKDARKRSRDRAAGARASKREA